jgi:glutaredoxin 3
MKEGRHCPISQRASTARSSRMPSRLLEQASPLVEGDGIAEPRSRADKRGYKSDTNPVQACSACLMFHGIYNRTIGSFFSSLASSSPRTAMSVKQTVDDVIANNKIVIFSKSYCPYCKKAKAILTSDFASLKDQIYIQECVLFHQKPSPKLTAALRLDEVRDGSEIQEYLREKSGQSTVPNIFINQKHVGGKY